MKRIFAAVLSAMLVLSLAACTDSTENSSQSSSGSSSVAEQSSEPDTSDLTVKEEDVSNLDTNSEAESEQSESSQKPEQNSSSQASSQKPEQNSSQAASQPPVEQKPAETSNPEKEEDVSNLDTKPESKPEKPAEQPSQPSTPAAPETEDTGWTQAKVDAVVEEYRTVALERGWKEDTRLNIELTNGGAWGLPIDTRNTDYNVIMTRANIEEEFYLYEYSKNKDPEDMTFHIVPKDCGDYWEIYVIFG